MRNIMKKCSVAALLIIMLIGCSITAQAAPKTMADGTIFDAEYYAANNQDVVQVLGASEAVLYSHYVSYGKAEGRKPCADNAAVSAVNAAVADTSFDAAYYAANNPDVVAVLGNDAAVLYQHYVKYGKAEGRKASAGTAAVTAAASTTSVNANSGFDAAYYATNNPDVVKVVGNSEAALYQHYVKYGKAEGRKASAGLAMTAAKAESQPAAAVPAAATGSYVVNHKNGKIHINGQCPATGTGKNAMDQPVSFGTYDEAAAYSVMRAPNLKKRNCGNCW